MLLFSSSAALWALGSTGACIATDTIEFEPEENFPPSIVSQLNAEFPLNEIAQINLDDPVESPEMPLEVVVRDPNFDQTLEYRIFLDSAPPPAPEVPVDDGIIEPVGGLDRPRTFTIQYDSLTPGICHRIELVVVGQFLNFVEPRRPVEEGDIDQVTWWAEVVDADNPVIVQECQ
jgi:hypothetical protein